MFPITVLSPHRDDAVFSICLSLNTWNTAKIPVSVINFFTRSAYAPRIASTDPDLVSRVRKREDRIALKRVAPTVRIVDMNLLDAPLRFDIKSDEICKSETKQLVSSAELSKLTRLIQNVARSRLVLAPLALGDHVDHWAIHLAALGANGACHVAYYEDLPYAAWTTEQAVRCRLREVEYALGRELRPLLIRAPKPAWRKRNLVARYKSQITPAEAACIANFSARYGGERIWYPAHSKRWSSILRHATIA